MNLSIIKKPSAWVPITLSLLTLALMLFYIATSPIVHETDEGTAAHLFQIWLALEAVMIVFFAGKWLPREPKQALVILALQIAAALLPMVVVFSLKL